MSPQVALHKSHGFTFTHLSQSYFLTYQTVDKAHVARTHGKYGFALNLKGLRYGTVWVEPPDVAAVSKEIGAKPTNEIAEYTLPAIKDPNNDTVISESINIVRYLDETYPNTPRLFDPSIIGLQLVTSHATHSALFMEILPLIILPTHDNLSPRSQVYFRETRERIFNKPLEEHCPPGEKENYQWTRLEQAFGRVAEWFDAQPGLFFVGDQASYPDVILASYFKWIQFATPKDRWDAILEWQGSRWRKLIDAFG